MTEITKMVMIGLVGALVIGVLIGFVVNEAYGEEEPLTIEGGTNTHGIFLSMEGSENIIMWDTQDGYSEHFDSKLKTYNSGGFSLKNPESGIAVWGHPTGDGTWRLVILTAPLREGYGVVRMTGSTVVMNEITTIDPASSNSTKTDPKSSIGSDISRYDIPTTGRDGGLSEHIYTIYSPRIKSLELGATYDKMFRVYDAKTNTNLEDIPVKLEIIRDGFVHKTIERDTEAGGLVRMELRDLEYPLFYPKFCYDVTVTAMVGNNTLTWEDDFTMIYPGVWDPNMDWIGESRWNYLPNNFEDEPRSTIPTDGRCN